MWRHTPTGLLIPARPIRGQRGGRLTRPRAQVALWLAMLSAILIQLPFAPAAAAAGPARTLVWSGASPSHSANWSAIGNWNLGAPNPAFTDSLDFPGTAGVPAITNNDVTGLIGLGSIKIESGYTITESMAPANDVGVTAGIQDTAGASTVGLNINFPGANSPETIQVDDGATLTLSGALSGGSGTAGAFVKTGAGALQLSNAGNSIAGVITISAGSVQDGVANGIPTADPITMSGGTTATALSLAGDQALPSIDSDSSGDVSLGSHFLTLDGNGLTNSATPHTIAGALSGTGGLTLSPSQASEGMFTVALPGSKAYTGVTEVDGGYLQVDGALASSAVKVAGWGSLTGGGSVGSTHAQSGGAVYPADGVAGTPVPMVLHTGSAALDGGSALEVLLKGTSPGGSGGYSQLSSSAAVDLTGSPDLTITLGYTPTIGDKLTIVDASSVSGTFASKPDKATLAVGGFPARIDYTGHSVTLTFLGRPTTTKIACTPNDPSSPSMTNGSPATCMATVKDQSGSPITPTNPTGTVTFSSSNVSGMFTPMSGQCSLVSVPASTDSSSCTVSYNSSSHDTIFGVYAGDSSHGASSSLRATATTVGCVPSTVSGSGSTICTVTAADAASGTPSAPLGIATLTSNGSGTFSPNTGDPSTGRCTVSPASGSQSACQVTYSAGFSPPHTDAISASYSPSDGIHSGSSGTTNVTFTPGGVDAVHSTVAASPASVPADGTTTSLVTVTLKDIHDNPVGGKAVTLAKSTGPGTPVITGPSPATTNAGGQTTFTVKSTTAGVDTFQATDSTDSVPITQTATVTFTPGSVNQGQSSVVANPTAVPADGTTTSTVTVTLKDVNGNPEIGKAVSLARTAGPGTPTISGPSPATTDTNGQTTFTVKSTTAGVDTFQATDTTDSVTITQTATVTFTTGPVNASHSTVSASPGSVPADGTTASTVTVTLKDVHDNPVTGKTVTLAKTGGPGAPTITGPSPATTNAAGQTTFTVKSTTAGADTFQATDTTDGMTVTQTATVTFTPGLVNQGQSGVVANPTVIPGDGTTTSTITVTLKDANGNPETGKVVTLAKIAGPGTPTITGPSPGTTNAAGQTMFTVKSVTPGTDTFRATDSTDSVVITQTANVTFTSGGVVLDGYGGLHPYGSQGSNIAGATYWGWDIARGVVLTSDSAGGYQLDGWGGIHNFGNAPARTASGYWPNWDIARGIALCGNGASGYTLDGYGGVHAFGGAAPISDGSHAYFQGWDIARGIAVKPDCTGGYTLDGWGGIHNFGSATAVADGSHAYWFNWDIARGLVMRADGQGGYLLDGWGGVHGWGNAGDPVTSAYWQNWDIANGLTLSPDGQSGYVLDGWGGVHPYGGAPNVSTTGYWPNWDIARGISGG